MPASAWLCRYCDMTGTQGFTHQLQPLVRSQSQHVCFIHGGTLAGAKCTWAHKLFILHLQKNKSWKYSLSKKKWQGSQKFPAPNYFARNALKTVHTCRDEVFAQFSTSLGRSSLSWEALQFSAAIYDKHIVPLLVSHYYSTCLQFHYFAHSMQFC